MRHTIEISKTVKIIYDTNKEDLTIITTDRLQEWLDVVMLTYKEVEIISKMMLEERTQ